MNTLLHYILIALCFHFNDINYYINTGDFYTQKLICPLKKSSSSHHFFLLICKCNAINAQTRTKIFNAINAKTAI